MAENVLIIGSGSQARYVIDTAAQLRWNLLGVADIESTANVGQQVNGIPIVCTLDQVRAKFKPNDCRVIIAYGHNQRKLAISKTLTQWEFQFINAISPLAYVAPSTKLGSGCIINPHATIMPNAILGHHVVVHSQAVIEHDNVLEDAVNIAPGVALAGRVRIGEGSYIYTGASVIPGIHIGRRTKVAAGATVIRDVDDDDVVVGVPARSILRKRRQS